MLSSKKRQKATDDWHWKTNFWLSAAVWSRRDAPVAKVLVQTLVPEDYKSTEILKPDRLNNELKVIPLCERVNADVLGKVRSVAELSRKALYLLRGSTKALNSSNRLLSLLSVQDEWGPLKVHSRGKKKPSVHFL